MFSKLINEGKPCPLSSIGFGMQDDLSGKVERECGSFIRMQYAVVATLQNIHFDMPDYIKDRLLAYEAKRHPSLENIYGIGLTFKSVPESTLYDSAFRKVLGHTVRDFDQYITFCVDSNQNQLWAGELETLGRLLDHLNHADTKAKIAADTSTAYGRLVWGHDALETPNPSVSGP